MTLAYVLLKPEGKGSVHITSKDVK